MSEQEMYLIASVLNITIGLESREKQGAIRNIGLGQKFYGSRKYIFYLHISF